MHLCENQSYQTTFKLKALVVYLAIQYVFQSFEAASRKRSKRELWMVVLAPNDTIKADTHGLKTQILTGAAKECNISSGKYIFYATICFQCAG